MCGRYASAKARDEIADHFGVDEVDADDLGERYNVAPTDPVYALIDRADDAGDVRRHLRSARWGLVPSWAKSAKSGPPLINARVETIFDKPSWRNAVRRRRAVIPADGYFEWTSETVDGKAVKQPSYLHPAGGDVLAFAGLYEWWPDPTKADDAPDRWLLSAAILTCSATGPAGEVHDRTPVILPAERIDAWLDPSVVEPADISDVLAGLQPPLLGIREVSRAVNAVANDGPELIAPVRADDVIQLRAAS